MDYKKLNAIIYAVLAALFYAINIPCSKLLLNNVAPTFMAAFLYLGAGLGVGIMYVFHAKKESRDERIGREDIPYTLAMVVLDIIAPILLMIGVKLGTAANASLLGNFEIVATTLIAFGLFREKVSNIPYYSGKHNPFIFRRGELFFFLGFGICSWSNCLLGT